MRCSASSITWTNGRGALAPLGKALPSIRYINTGILEERVLSSKNDILLAKNRQTG